ncbi:Conserved protein of unknown function [Modestobacter italicus]|uniref:Transmembrane protein n=1 Tax=Modestobacter italicus (strain DSM 44449 / CECT 9708 / BC 501) TaxID=2732864 RepID=I4EYX9_MODI5|nr:hypothetical protein [Modestobacter marinus]CCH88592.1 Conserved protein of unknown function [Modestobacter marinus]
MRLYADRPDHRTRQLAADAGLLAWAVLWVLVARVVHGAVLVLAEPGRAVADLGRSISDSMDSAAGAADGVPLVGDELSAPFGALSDAGGSVTGAGTSASDAVHTLAAVLAVVLVVLPVGWLLVRWLRWRLAWLREATAADRLLAHGADGLPDLELLAARAMATAPLPQLARLPAGTGAGWRAGDPAALRALAGLELRRLGLRVPEADGAGVS